MILRAPHRHSWERLSRLAAWCCAAIVLLSWVATARAAETMPAKPTRYFNDYTGTISPATGDEFNRKLEQFERDTSNQVWVVVYPKMLSDSSIEDYTVRVAQAWHVGVKGKDNGVVLFVFLDGDKIYIQVGYGLEGALPDAMCKEIIDEGIAPRFKVKDYTGGLRAGIAGIMAATKGEYQGTGKTTNEQLAGRILAYMPCWGSGLIIFVAFGVLLFVIHNFGGTFYQRHVRSLSFAENAYMFLLNMILSVAFSGGSSSSSGGSSGSASSGGGSFGGGGAGGSW